MTSTAIVSAEPGILEGVRVVEVTALPGQYTGRLFADLGADVITIEPPRGDRVRGLPPFAHEIWGLTRSLPWLQLNSGKRSLALDRESQDGRAIFAKLVKTTDVLLCSGAVAELERLGVPFDAPPFGPRADGRARMDGRRSSPQSRPTAGPDRSGLSKART